MIRYFRTYPDSDDEADLLIGYSPAGFAIPETAAEAPAPDDAKLPGGKQTQYLLAMAATGEEFTVRELRAHFGIAKQGARMYAVLAALVDAGVLTMRTGARNVRHYRGAR